MRIEVGIRVEYIWSLSLQLNVMTANTMELSDVRKLVKTYLRVSIAFDIGDGEKTHNTQ